MGVAGIIVARTDAESATLLDGRSDERDQPFILGATNLDLPTFKAAFLAMLRAASQARHRGALRPPALRRFRGRVRSGRRLAREASASCTIVEESVADYAARAPRWTTRSTRSFDRFVDALADRGRRQDLRRGRRRRRCDFRTAEGVQFPITREQWLAFAARASYYEARAKARSLGIVITWDCEHAKTPDGYYQVRGGIDYAIAKSLAAAPYADLLWMETKTADLHDAKVFADAIHAVYPDKMLAYNLSPSFNWDTTGHDGRADAALPRGARQARVRLQLHHLRRPPN